MEAIYLANLCGTQIALGFTESTNSMIQLKMIFEIFLAPQESCLKLERC